MAEEFNPLELSRTEFESFVKGLQGGESTQTVAQLPPSPAEGQQLPTVVRDQTQDRLMEENVRMGMRPGASLDTKSGVDSLTRYALGTDENQLNQFKLLTQIYGEGNVDLSEEGRFILRNQPTKYGGTTDIMVDPVGVDRGDFAEIASQWMPMAMGAVAAFKSGRIPKGNVAKALTAVIGGAVGTELSGGVQDSFVRWMQDNEVNATEIAKKRGQMAIADTIFGVVAAGGAKAATKAAEAFMGFPLWTEIGTTPTKEAAKGIQKKFGVKYPLSPGEASENEIAMRIEGVATKRLGTTGVMERNFAAKEAAENELRRVFLGLPRTMSDDDLMRSLPKSEDFGSRALQKLRGTASELEGAVSSAREDVLKTGTEEIQKLGRVNLGSPLDSSDVGKAARARAVNEFKQTQSEFGARYDDFLSKPEVSSQIVEVDDLANAAAEVEKKFVPKKTIPSERKTILAGTKASDSIPVGKESVNLDDFVPGKFRSAVETLKGLKGATTSVGDLKKIRTSINNSIAEGVSIPGTDVAQLKALGKTVDDAITNSLKGMDDPSLLREWESLSSDYEKRSSRFDRVGIREMLVTEGERGSIGDAKLAESIIGNTPDAKDQYRNLKEFFGEGSKEFEDLKQVAREKTLFGSLGEINDYVDGQVLRTRLRNIRPEIAKELFGADEKELHRIGEVLSRAQGKLDTEEIRKLATSKSLTATKLEALEKAEDELSKAYNNKLIKAASKGALNAEKIQPSDFVRHAMAMDSQEASKVISALSDQPEMVREIRQLAIEDVWDKIAIRHGDKKLVSAKALEDVLGKKTDTFRLIVGEETYDGLRLLLKAVSPREATAAKFGGAAGLSGSMDLQSLFLAGEVGSLKHIASRWLVASIYGGPLRKMITNLATSSDRSRLINGVVASTPFLEETLDKFGPDGALMIINELRDAVEPLQRKELAIQGEIKDFDPTELSKDEFKEWLKNNVRQ